MAGEEAGAIAPMWHNFLAAMTAQGASRMDVIQMALGTAMTVLSETATALWPEGTATVAEEEAIRSEFSRAMAELRNSATALAPE